MKVYSFEQAKSLHDTLILEELDKTTVEKAIILWLATLSPQTRINYQSLMRKQTPPDSLRLVLERIGAYELCYFVGKKKNPSMVSSRYVLKVSRSGTFRKILGARCKTFWAEVPKP